MTSIFTRFSLFAFVVYSLGSCSNPSSSGEEAGADTQAKQEVLSNPELEAAQVNFETYCAGCHGDKAVTFADRRWKHGQEPEDLFESIKFGHPDAGMPAFENTFSDEEIQGLVTYIRQGMEKVEQYSFEEEQSLPDTFHTEMLSFTLDTVVSGFGEVPWGMAFLPNGDMLATEISGSLFRFSKDGGMQEVKGVPLVLAKGQGGLLDVVLHPDFGQNNIIYLSFSAFKEEDGDTLSTTAVVRAKLEGNTLSQQEKIFEALPYSETRHHYGSRMEFGRDGNLYISVGDRGNRDENPQSLNRHPGKIHRITADGGIPADNPFLDQEGAYPSIYSYGHRNPQGLAIHPETGELWEHEHGPRGGDEVNIIEKGRNYGWPVISYGINYDGTTFTDKTRQEGMLQPLWYWVPSIAPAGMTFVRGGRYKGWEGDLLSGSLRFQYLNRNKMEGRENVGEEQLLKNIGRVRDVKMSPDGFIHVAVEEPARIYRLVPVPEM